MVRDRETQNHRSRETDTWTKRLKERDNRYMQQRHIREQLEKGAETTPILGQNQVRIEGQGPS